MISQFSRNWVNYLLWFAKWQQWWQELNLCVCLLCCMYSMCNLSAYLWSSLPSRILCIETGSKSLVGSLAPMWPSLKSLLASILLRPLRFSHLTEDSRAVLMMQHCVYLEYASCYSEFSKREHFNSTLYKKMCHSWPASRLVRYKDLKKWFEIGRW